MGLQFIDDNGDERTLTEADMLLPEFKDAYSDLFKGLNGWRPRGDYFWAPDVMLRFFDTYEVEIARQAEIEAAIDAQHLADLEHEHQRKFENPSEALRYDEQQAFARHLARMAEEEERRELISERWRRFSPLPAIEAWEHGG